MITSKYETMTIEEFSNFINKFLRINTVIKDTNIEIEIAVQYSDHEIKKKYFVDKNYLQNLFTELSKIDKIGETAIRSGNNYEFLIKMASPRPFLSLDPLKSFLKEDSANHILYKLDLPTDLYLVYFLHEIKNANIDFFRNSYIMGSKLERIVVDGEETDFLKILKIIIPRFLTAQISSTKKRQNSDYEDLGNSLLFQLSYNLTISIIHIRYLEEFIKSGRITKLNRAKISDDIEPPKRKYLSDLVSHYQLALSADSPYLKYLAFYHIMEHFFEDVYNKDIIHSIQHEITKPAFSYNRERDISKLVSFIKKKLGEKTDQYDINEKEALILTLKQYVINFNNIKNELNQYDKNLIDYYKKIQVSFSGGDAVDLNSPDIAEIQIRLANRIYKTRNSIVHSKKSDKLKYIPFSHDKDLLKEIPLLQFLSEEIIIASSSLIED